MHYTHIAKLEQVRRRVQLLVYDFDRAPPITHRRSEWRYCDAIWNPDTRFNDKCFICLDPDAEATTQLPCGHCMCEDCEFQHRYTRLNRTPKCPMCSAAYEYTIEIID